MFQKAIELDPKYPDAYAMLGWVQFEAMYSQWSHDPHGIDRVIQLEHKSIALDNSNTWAYALLSYTYTLTRQYDLGITTAERALAINPNSAQGYDSMAAALAYSGKPAQAVAAEHQAMRLDPRHRDVYSLIEGVAYTLMGRYDKAVPALQRYLARHSNVIPGHLYLIACYVELGRNEEARAEAAEVMRANPQYSLAFLKQHSPVKERPDRLYGDMAKAGLK
jgi:tetratricopeptide (TPR) repeat protein